MEKGQAPRDRHPYSAASVLAHAKLLSWYDARRRRLPWREAPSPYRTWISEIMLQQTTVAAVVPHFDRFTARFPDVHALAAANEESVVRAWAGLGYYSRARNLHRAARRIASEHGGVFPSDWETVLDLPGVGRYTAGAILSIAFGQRRPVVDGNVARVYARLFALRRDVKSSGVQRRLWQLAERLLPQRRCGDWNQALMELGATVCLPDSPRCDVCPLAADCQARKRGLQDRLPVVGPRPEPLDLSWTCLWIERAGRVVLWKREDSERFLKGHWGLPEARHLEARLGPVVRRARHAITRHRIQLEVRRAAVIGPLPRQARWIGKGELRSHLVSSLWVKCLPASSTKGRRRPAQSAR